MPSAKILSEKQAYVADLKAKFESAVSGCVVAYGGINVENDTKLRKEPVSYTHLTLPTILLV